MGKTETKNVGCTITVHVDMSFAARVDDLARAEGRTRSNYVKCLLERELRNAQQNNDTKKGHR